jgi:hypothetical protein
MSSGDDEVTLILTRLGVEDDYELAGACLLSLRSSEKCMAVQVDEERRNGRGYVRKASTASATESKATLLPAIVYGRAYENPDK